MSLLLFWVNLVLLYCHHYNIFNVKNKFEKTKFYLKLLIFTVVPMILEPKESECVFLRKGNKQKKKKKKKEKKTTISWNTSLIIYIFKHI